MRGGQGGPGHQDLVGQPRVAACGNRGGASCRHGREQKTRGVERWTDRRRHGRGQRDGTDAESKQLGEALLSPATC